MPTSLTPLDGLVLYVHADAHQDKLGKAILPMRELIERFNYHPKSLERSRGRLVKVGALVRVTKGYEDQASEYAVSEEFLLAHQVTPRLRVSRNKRTSGSQVVTRELYGSNVMDTDTLPDGYPILKDEQTNKRKDQELVSSSQIQPKSATTRINAQRWQVVTGELPKDVLRCITPNSYSENLLDQAITNGYSPSHLRRHFGSMTWGNSHDIGGLFISELRKFAGVANPRQDASPPWCGEDGCDPITRTWLQASPRDDGSMTNNCPQCHPLEVRTTKENESATEVKDFINHTLRNFGAIPE